MEEIQQVQTSANTENNKPKPTQNTQAGKTVKPKRKIPTSGNGWTNDLKKAFEINEKIQKDRLNPHNKLNLKN